MKSPLCLSLLVLFSTAIWGGPIEYSVAYLRGSLNNMRGVNDSGQVSGASGNNAVIANPAGNTLIPLPLGWTSANGEAINASGQVAGSVHNGAISQPFIGDASGSTVIPLPAGWTTGGAQAINAAGQIVGSGRRPDGHIRAFIGDASGVTEIPAPLGALDTFGFGVNASGQVTGWSYDGVHIRPFIGDVSGTVLMPLPADWTFEVFAWAINDAGLALVRGNNGTQWNLWLGDASGGTLIPAPVGATVVSLSVGSLNNHNVVVGTATDNAAFHAGFMWDSVHGTRVLNDLVPPEWTIPIAISISDNGNILARGTGPQGEGYLLLTPLAVPEPGTFALLGCGLAALAVARKRR